MFWLFAFALTLTVALAILRPFWRARPATAEPAASYDLRVYRDQLTEVDRDLARGIITPAEAERLRVEIGRKVLEADRTLSRDSTAPGVMQRHAVIASIVLALLIGAGWLLYTRIGAPNEPDMALKSRIAAAEARYAARPHQAEAEARHAENNPVPAPAPDADFAALMDQLRAAVATHPDDLRGLTLLAQNEARLGNSVAAKTAQAHLIEVKGTSATAVDHAMLAGFMTEAAGGIITPEAEREIARALDLDPANPQARYMTGLLQAQNGRPDRAFPVWASLLEDTPPDSPWNKAIGEVIEDMAWLAGVPDYRPPSAPPLAGPDGAAMAAAADMSPEDRQAFIQSMVDQLQSRLATEGGSPEEWAQLINALGVLGNRDHAVEIYTEARSVFANMPDALAAVDAAAKNAGIAP